MNFKNWITKNWLYIFIFTFFLYINFLSPPIGDDWEIGNWFSTNSSGDIIMAIRGVYDNWLHFNGRGLSNLLMSFFCYYKNVWNFVSAGMFLFIIYAFGKLLDYKENKVPIALSIILILSVSNNIRMETYSLICANIAFMVPFVFILFYLIKTKKYLLNNNEQTKYKKSFLILISLFCLIISTLMENISAGFTITLGILNLYIFIKNKHFDRLFIYSFIFSLLGSIFMFTSPGMHSGRELYNNSLGLFGTLKMSLPNNINLIIFENKFIFFSITLSTFIAILINSISINKKIIKYIYLSFLVLILFILIIPIINPYIFTPLFFDKIFNLANRITSHFLIIRFTTSIFWSFFLFSFIVPILYIKKNRKVFLFLFSIAIFSLIPASLVTQVGARIIMIIVFMFIGIGCGILSQIKLNYKNIYKIIFSIIIFGIFVQVNKFLVIYHEIYKIEKIRELLTNDTAILQYKKEWDYNKPLIIPSFKMNTLFYTANPPPLKTSCHYLNFKKYYQLNPETKVVFDDGFGYISLNFNLEKKDNIAKMEIKPLEENYTYKFYIYKNNLDYYVSTQSANMIQTIKITEPGTYSLKCNMFDKNNNFKTAYSADEIIIK